MVSAITLGSSQFKTVPQVTYKSSIRQDGWIQRPPIDFGWLRLTDAIDPDYLGIPDHNDRVLDYEGVGSAIPIRLSVSLLSQPPRGDSTPSHLF